MNPHVLDLKKHELCWQRVGPRNVVLLAELGKEPGATEGKVHA